MRYVIVGNSAAAVGAVEGIRQIDGQGEIVIISDEAYHTYSRPLISYLLLGKATEEKLKYRDDDFYVKNNCTLLSGLKATSINASDKNVVMSDGGTITYDKLLVATGSSAFVPPFEKFDTVAGKFTFMCLDDALSLKNALNRNSRVLIVGAGLIGLKCAEGILNSVREITVVDFAPTILPSILDVGGARIVQNHLEGKGIKFKLSHGVKSFTENKAVLDSGEVLNFDIVVLAVGVRPNTGLLKDIAKVEKGIVIDAKMETSCPDIYAAGDCTQSFDASSGQSRIMALLPNAYMQGECAGINMAGGSAEFNKAMPMNAVGFFGLHVITAGNYSGDKYCEADGSNYKMLFYKDNRLNGYILIGNVEKAGIYTSLIRERTSLDALNFDLICKKPGLMAFAKEDRTVKLGGGIQ